MQKVFTKGPVFRKHILLLTNASQKKKPNGQQGTGSKAGQAHARLKILQANIACNSEWRGSRVAKGNRL